MSEPPPEEPYQLPDTEPAWEPVTLPNRPLTAAEASCFVPKIVSLALPACTTCGAQLVSVPPAPGFLAPRWGHLVPPADGHEPGVPPVIVTYSRDVAGWRADCPEVPGFPVRGAVSLGEAKSVAWVLLGRIGPPPMPVIERYPDA